MINIPVKRQTHGTGSALEPVFQQVTFGQDGIFPADIFVVTGIGLDGDDFFIPDMCLNNTVLVAATITLAGRVNGLQCFPAAAGF